MAEKDRSSPVSGGNRARLVAVVLIAIMAVLLVFALFWNPFSVK